MIHDAGNRKIATAAFVLAALLPLSASAASYYADSVNGSDSNSGSITSPWQYIDTSAHKLAPGDTLYLRKGSYGLSPSNNWGSIHLSTPGDDGAAGALKTIKAYPGETATVATGVSLAANYWRWEGLTFDFTTGGMFLVRPDGAWDSLPIPAGNTPPMGHETPGVWIHNVQIVGNIFKGLVQQGSGGIHTWASNVLIENNDMSRMRSACTTCGLPGVAMYVSAGDNIVIRGNIIAGLKEYVLQVYDERRATNEVYTRWLTNFLVENNTVYSPAGGLVGGDGGSYISQGIEIGAGSYTLGQNVLLRNNVVYGTIDEGIQLDGGGWTGVKIYNNVCFQPAPNAYPSTDGSSTACLNIRSVSSPSGAVVENNIFDLGANYAGTSHVKTHNLSFTLANNLYYPVLIKYNGGGTTDSNPIQGDPLFANASTDPSVANFHLTAGSAAIDKGLTLAADVPGDKDGVCRPQGAGFDIGAYEFCASGSCPATCGSGSGTIVNALPPAPPRGFHLQ